MALMTPTERSVKKMDCSATLAVDDLVYQDYSQVNTALKATDHNAPSPVIGVVLSKPTTTTALILLRGIHKTTITQGPLFVSTTGTIQVGVPLTGRWQRLGHSFGDGKIWLEPERIRIRNP